MRGLREHLEKDHKEEGPENTFMCQQCIESPEFADPNVDLSVIIFKSKQALKSHIDLKHSDPSQPLIQCPKCPQEIQTEKIHEGAHENPS